MSSREAVHRIRGTIRVPAIGRAGALAAWGALIVMLVAGCGANMRNQPKYTVYQSSSFFSDRSADRPLPRGVVPAGPQAVAPSALGRIPVPVTKQLLERGMTEYDVYCMPCHGATGYGDGMVVRRGFKHPPSYHTPRLRRLPDSHFYDVITKGYGAMPSYGYLISPKDRWAIVAYIRALQLSQHASIRDVPPVERRRLTGGSRR